MGLRDASTISELVLTPREAPSPEKLAPTLLSLGDLLGRKKAQEEK